MNFYCFVDVSTDKAIIIKTNNSKNNYKNTFNLNVTKNYVYHFKFESYIVWSYLIYVRTMYVKFLIDARRVVWH